MKKTHFVVHPIAERAFQAAGSGTLVTDPDKFWQALEAADFQNPSVGGKSGQMMLSIPVDCVSGAYAPLADVDPADIRAGLHRGRIEVYVPRGKYRSAPVASVMAIVYTRQAIKDDPDWDGKEPDADYTIVAVLAQVSADGSDPLAASSFCHNLAGGNLRYQPENGYSLEKAIAEAARVEKFFLTYIKVG